MSPFVSDRGEPVFCPSPCRIIPLHGCEPVRTIRRQHAEPFCPKTAPGDEVLDIILAKGAHGGGRVASSPPYFSGSPPSRAANPLVHDARFGEEGAAPPAPLPVPAFLAGTGAPPSSSAGGGRNGCVRKGFGPNPAAVRIEGFDCLDRGGRRGSCSISAVA